ncbi:MAG: nicotinamidase [Candidatus Hydrogenedentes bacterium]|nr:nicotinamidase [Candidatus Hydrogenedentota bacterium]
MKIEPTDALIVVDVQNDFCRGGALAVEAGDEVVPVINGVIPRFLYAAFTRDWHPHDHCSFSDDPQWVDKSWPRHCVQNTRGAEFHPGLQVPAKSLIISKGNQTHREAYSGFQGTPLDAELRARHVNRIFVGGLATDYCVKTTALDGARNGFQVVLLEDACRGVDRPAGSVAKAVAEMNQAGVTVTTTGDLS